MQPTGSSYPVSALVLFEVLIRPLIRTSLGRNDPKRRRIAARLLSPVVSIPGRRGYLRGRLLREEGLDSCAQEAWSLYPQTVGSVLDLPSGRILFTGMAIGWRDPAHPVNELVSDRAPIDEWARFIGV